MTDESAPAANPGRGGHRSGAGRKPGSTPRRVIVSAAVPPDVKAKLIQAAKSCDCSLSAIIAFVLTDMARKPGDL
jgi:hypothetical protein